MSSVGNELNEIGQTEVPALSDDFPDVMNITTETTVTGTGGGQIKGGTSNAYTSVPVVYEPLSSGQRSAYADRLVSSAGYKLTMPTHWPAGTRINLDMKAHTLLVAARGNEPAKTFRPVALLDMMGVLFEVIADKEN